MTDYEKAEEKIAGQIAESHGYVYPCGVEEEDDSFRYWADQILDLKWPDGSPMIGVIAKDQSVPPLKPGMFPQIGAGASDGYKRGEQDMLQANFRRLAEEQSK